ncbi:reverse transcriptase/maturase family protein [Aeromonas fluvialis]|uniref:reverse transcriptase/maturase family protein n=1 Tax=Aeromonas fluvialis TaxID=591962 RepID=UPI000A8AB8C9|nr:reverse transcriptase/maturase family protein [Aeromonas fluvialis]
MKNVTQEKTAMSTQALTHPQQLETALAWLCSVRKHFPANADIWHLRFHRKRLLPELLAKLAAGTYQFSPMQVVQRADGNEIALWCAADALVLKLITLHLQTILPVHRSCTHVKGHGGHKCAVRQTHQWINDGAYAFVCKTDIKGYYANINKHQLLELLAKRIDCPLLMNLLGQFMFYSVETGGNFHTPIRGIPRSCPLSPLLAGFHLYALDQDLSSRVGVRYLRFMDDLLIFSQTRWQLKRAVTAMNQWFTAAGLRQHPDKTFIGRITKGFDWIGYRFNADGLLAIASKTHEKHLLNLHLLYEQARRLRHSPEQTQQRVVEYCLRWQRWALAGLAFDGSGLRQALAVQDISGDGVSP